MPTPPDDYRALEQTVDIHARLTEVQFRHIEALLDEQPMSATPSGPNFLFDLTVDQSAAAAVLSYLREQRLPHTFAAEWRWDPNP